VNRKRVRKKSIFDAVSKAPFMESQAKLSLLGAAMNKKKTGLDIAGSLSPPETAPSNGPCQVKTRKQHSFHPILAAAWAPTKLSIKKGFIFKKIVTNGKDKNSFSHAMYRQPWKELGSDALRYSPTRLIIWNG